MREAADKGWLLPFTIAECMPPDHSLKEMRPTAGLAKLGGLWVRAVRPEYQLLQAVGNHLA